MSETTAQRIARLAAGAKEPVATADVPKTDKVKKGGYQKKGGNGGARAGAGRKPEEERKAENRQGFQDFANETVEINVGTKKNPRYVKNTRKEIARLKLFEKIYLHGDLRAIEEFDDRTMGRAMQPIGGDAGEPIVLKIDI